MKIKTNVKVGATNGTMHVGSGSTLTAARGLKVKSRVKAGQSTMQHSQTMARGLKVKKGIKAGEMPMQHNQTVAHGLRVKTNAKAGAAVPSPDPGGGPPGLASKP